MPACALPGSPAMSKRYRRCCVWIPSTQTPDSRILPLATATATPPQLARPKGSTPLSTASWRATTLSIWQPSAATRFLMGRRLTTRLQRCHSCLICQSPPGPPPAGPEVALIPPTPCCIAQPSRASCAATTSSPTRWPAPHRRASRSPAVGPGVLIPSMLPTPPG